MTYTIPNNKPPAFARREPFAEFRLILRRDGDNVKLEVPAPRIFRDFRAFSGVEKDAYNSILTHVIDTAGAAIRKAARNDPREA